MARWTCPLCTFVDNDASQLHCEVCGAPNPTQPAGSQQQSELAQVEQDEAQSLGQASEAEEEGDEDIEEAEHDLIGRWCTDASHSFNALCTVAILFHARAAPLFLKSVAPTIAQHSGRPFDEVTARAMAAIRCVYNIGTRNLLR